MALLNYSDLLRYLGLSNWQFIALLLLLLFLWAIAATLWKIGALKKVNVLTTILPPLKCVYISFLGNYDYFDRIYSQSVEDFQMVFKFSSYFSIFYDDPSTQHPGAQSRALIGVFVSELQQTKIKLFLSKFPQYKVADFPQTKCLSAEYPFVGSLSSILAIGVVYPALQKKVEDLKLSLKCRQILEIYHSNQQMSIVVPVENQLAFQKWYEPTAYSRVQQTKSQ